MRLILIFLTLFTFFLNNTQPYAASSLPEKRILLIVAMQEEAMPIVNSLQLKKSSHSFSGLPMRAYEGRFAGARLFLVMNGKDPVYRVENIGTQPAALATYLGIQHFQPDLVISIGTAGGVTEQNAKIGDVYLSEKLYFYDRRSPQKGYTEYGMGGYSSAPMEKIAKKIDLKIGNVCTGDSFDISPTDKVIILKHRCSAVEMEAASVAWVSMLMKKPMIAIKGIGDLLGVESEAQYAKNAGFVQNRLGEKIKEFITYYSE